MPASTPDSSDSPAWFPDHRAAFPDNQYIAHCDVFRAEKVQMCAYLRFTYKAFDFGGIEFEENIKNYDYNAKQDKHLFIFIKNTI